MITVTGPPTADVDLAREATGSNTGGDLARITLGSSATLPVTVDVVVVVLTENGCGSAPWARMARRVFR